MDYFKGIVQVSFAVGSTYTVGDYARMHVTTAATSIDYNTRIDNIQYPLFGKSNQSGIFGFGQGTFGKHNFGTIEGRNISGYGNITFGNTPFGRGSAYVTVNYEALTPNKYNFAFSVYDVAGNVHSGTPDEESAYVCLRPKRPNPLKRSSYNNGTTTIIFTV